MSGVACRACRRGDPRRTAHRRRQRQLPRSKPKQHRLRRPRTRAHPPTWPRTSAMTSHWSFVCESGWAYATYLGGTGDTEFIAQRLDGVWVRVMGMGSPTCQDELLDEGAPQPVVVDVSRLRGPSAGRPEAAQRRPRGHHRSGLDRHHAGRPAGRQGHAVQLRGRRRQPVPLQR